jgi:hypothetical protein
LYTNSREISASNEAKFSPGVAAGPEALACTEKICPSVVELPIICTPGEEVSRVLEDEGSRRILDRSLVPALGFNLANG